MIRPSAIDALPRRERKAPASSGTWKPSKLKMTPPTVAISSGFFNNSNSRPPLFLTSAWTAAILHKGTAKPITRPINEVPSAPPRRLAIASAI
ncbi:hypothetical protein D3C81_1785760 [compost metagenome]